ncbi:MAG: hypothetical protein HLUCCX21_06955 [Porphyrobacter sp. HL-46]|nr:MAG: hypothetical protein HLUCCX21_06955 [Porphyrobacter sp. HL-46]
MGRVMARKPIMLTPVEWHIWLGCQVRVPIAMGPGTGLFPTLRPIAEGRNRWWDRCENPQGRHITKPRNHDAASHPAPIAFAALSLARAMTGCVVMFRQRRARPAVLFGQ